MSTTLDYLSFEYKKEKVKELGTTLTREFWTNDKYCVKSFKVGKNRIKYNIFKNWNKEQQCGRIISCDIDKKDINSFLNTYNIFE